MSRRELYKGTEIWTHYEQLNFTKEITKIIVSNGAMKVLYLNVSSTNNSQDYITPRHYSFLANSDSFEFLYEF